MDNTVISTYFSLLFLFLCTDGRQTVLLTGQEVKTPPTLACGGVDLVFLVDSSRSIYDLDFQRQIDFVDKVVTKFDIGPGDQQTRVGVILYAQTFWLRFYLRSHLDLSSLRKAIQRIPHKHGSTTRTEKAIKFLRTHMFKPWYGARNNATHVAIIISDGRSQDRKATRTEAQLTKEAGILLFTIGVGKGADLQELKEIASDPDEYFVFQVGNFEALDSLNYRLPTSTCVAGAITTLTTTLPTNTTTVPRGTTPPTVDFVDLLLNGKTIKTDMKSQEYKTNLEQVNTNTNSRENQVNSSSVHEYNTKGSQNEINKDINLPADTNVTIIIQDNAQQDLLNAKKTFFSLNRDSTDLSQTTLAQDIWTITTQKTSLDINSTEISDTRSITHDDILNPSERIILSNKNSEHADVTPPILNSLDIYKTGRKSLLERFMPSPADTSTTGSPKDLLTEFKTLYPLTKAETTTISNEILHELSAYSIKPITQDQAQILSNYILRDVPAQSYCDGKDADIYFVLDASNSIWPEDFKQQLSFVNNVIDILDVTHGNTRVGVVVYSTQIHPIVMINSGLSKQQIKRQVNAIQFLSGRTNTSDALRFVRRYGFAPDLTRKGAVKLGIVLTDGMSRNPIATKTESNMCRDDGIHLFAVGIGKNVDQTELKRIANDPDHKFMFHVDSYSALNSIKDFLAITACSVVPDQPSNLPLCSGLGAMDVVFAYDSFALGSRKSQMINFFIHDILNSLDFSKGNLQVGRLTDNCPEFTNIPISAGKNLSAFANIVYPGISNLLQKMNSSFSNRDDVKKLGVLFIDDSTEGIERAISVLKAGLDYKLMVIGIGEEKSTEPAGDLCSYPKHDYFLQVPAYSSLLRARSKLLDKLCTSLISAG